MELVAPAGSLDKLKTAFAFGADAVYLGASDLSLRARADGFGPGDFHALARLKAGKRLYCAVNIYFKDKDLRGLESMLDASGIMPFDAFIVSDPGALRLLSRRYPSVELHLSTQANCTNAEAARFWRDMGCARVIPGRELSIDEIAAIKREVPDLGIEVFAHGAMCVAYSGRCFLSAWMAARSGNDGSCAQSCRWDYRVLEERKRPGEYYPVVENGEFATILSSKDLRMIEHLDELAEAGADAIKIEGRMRSSYYVAVTTRAYRAAIDRLAGRYAGDFEAMLEELETVSHREYCTGFYFGKEVVGKPALSGYLGESLFIGTVTRTVNPGIYEIELRNHVEPEYQLEALLPSRCVPIGDFSLVGEYGDKLRHADFGTRCVVVTDCSLEAGTILRRRVDALPTASRRDLP